VHHLGGRPPGPTLLIETDAATGITDEHVDQLLSWHWRFNASRAKVA
jgi:hypothetical protein